MIVSFGFQSYSAAFSCQKGYLFFGQYTTKTATVQCMFAGISKPLEKRRAAVTRNL